MSILEILNVFLRLKFSPSLNLNKNEHFSKVSMFRFQTELFETIFIILFHCKDQHIQIPWQDFSYPLVNRHQVPPIGLIGNPVKIGSGPAAVIPTLLKAISKLGFSVEIKARPRINPQAYSSMSRTWYEGSTPISGEKTFLRWLL